MYEFLPCFSTNRKGIRWNLKLQTSRWIYKIELNKVELVVPSLGIGFNGVEVTFPIGSQYILNNKIRWANKAEEEITDLSQFCEKREGMKMKRNGLPTRHLWANERREALVFILLGSSESAHHLFDENTERTKKEAADESLKPSELPCPVAPLKNEIKIEMRNRVGLSEAD